MFNNIIWLLAGAITLALGYTVYGVQIFDLVEEQVITVTELCFIILYLYKIQADVLKWLQVECGSPVNLFIHS